MKIVKIFNTLDVPSDIRWITNISAEIIRDILKHGRSLKYTRAEYAHVPNKYWKRGDKAIVEKIVAAKENGTLLREKGFHPRLPTRDQWVEIDEDWADRQTRVTYVLSPASPGPDLPCVRCDEHIHWCTCTFNDCK